MTAFFIQGGFMKIYDFDKQLEMAGIAGKINFITRVIGEINDSEFRTKDMEELLNKCLKLILSINKT